MYLINETDEFKYAKAYSTKSAAIQVIRDCGLSYPAIIVSRAPAQFIPIMFLPDTPARRNKKSLEAQGILVFIR
jgi:hypothetical protein